MPDYAGCFESAYFHGHRHDYGRAEKVYPVSYGATPEKELFLCYVQFATSRVCPAGAHCRFRHNPLSEKEVAFMAQTKAGRGFLALYADRYFAGGIPQITGIPLPPLPGASRQQKGKRPATAMREEKEAEEKAKGKKKGKKEGGEEGG